MSSKESNGSPSPLTEGAARRMALILEKRRASLSDEKKKDRVYKIGRFRERVRPNVEKEPAEAKQASV